MEENPAPVDRSLFIPLGVGVFALVGICLVLLALRLSAAQGSVPMTPTVTPLKYLYLGTEPVVVQPTDLPTPTEVFATPPTPTAFVFPTQLLSPTAHSTLLVLSTNTRAANTSTRAAGPTATNATITATNSTAEPSTKFDDMDSVITYTGNWVSQTGLTNTYKETLHISNTIGDALQFTFYGERFQFIYQAGPTLGAVAIHMDSTDFTLDQSATTTGTGEWDSPTLTIASHTVTITHISGGSVNIDSIVLFLLPTPTPTMTPTATRTPKP